MTLYHPTHKDGRTGQSKKPNGTILAFRERKKWTQARLAAELGVRQATVSDWENGTVKPSRLAILALSYIGFKK